jgi:hypothetical protein
MSTDEQTLLETPTATVTTNRIVLAGTTYATRNVSSVRSKPLPRRRIGPLFAILFAMIWLVFAVPARSQVNVALAITLGAWGVYWLFIAKTQHAVMLVTNAGETQALTSPDAQAIATITDAIARAIASR